MRGRGRWSDGAPFPSLGDAIRVRLDSAASSETLRSHEHVERAVVGHVHRATQTRLGAVPVLSCPRTVTQIAPRTAAAATPASYRESPALWLHRWIDEQPAVSHLSYIAPYDGPFPFA